MPKADSAPTANGRAPSSAVVLRSPQPPQLAQRSEAASLMSAIIKVAAPPQTDVAKIKELVQLHQSMQDRDAQRRFDEALVACQTELQPVTADAVNNHANNHRYATYTALDRVI